ncbi:HNH endonuclease [Sphingomonas prati]|uniref:HNH endonuclease n=1 Tax=Sphingomonas prati TaxID=1843237 RepID=UPI0012F66F1E|nr:HNH endonuclease signature motif containing protein [Sphingomonas prati]
MVERLRGSAGVAQRRRRLAHTNGLCERCPDRGRTTLAVEVDHIVPLDKGGTDDDSNTRNLCKSCHLEVTAEQFGHRPPIEGRGISRSGRPTSADHPWNRGR